MTSAVDGGLGKTVAYANDVRGLCTQMNVDAGLMLVNYAFAVGTQFGRLLEHLRAKGCSNKAECSSNSFAHRKRRRRQPQNECALIGLAFGTVQSLITDDQTSRSGRIANSDQVHDN
jgi:hypothetical protein